MDNETLVRHMLTQARRDMFNNKGRIILSDFLTAINEKIDVLHMLTVWRQYYPNHNISHPTNNVLIIELGRLAVLGRPISLENQKIAPRMEE